MSHMVIYRGSDGKPGYHQTDDIHDAVGFVEQMRNDEGVEHARIFRLEEVVFQYKPYYRVELAESAPAQVDSTDGDGGPAAESSGGASDAGTDNGDGGSGSNGSADSGDADTAGDSDGGTAEVKKGLFGR